MNYNIAQDVMKNYQIKEQIRRKIVKGYQCPNCGKWINERGIMW